MACAIKQSIGEVTKPLVARLQHYINEDQIDRGTYVHPLTYGYRMQVHRASNPFSFSSVRGRDPLTALVFEKNRPSEKRKTMQLNQEKLRQQKILSLSKQQPGSHAKKEGEPYDW